jgi:tetratricopeptide (TPR) repeat protein
MRRVLALVWLNCGHPEKGAALVGDDTLLAGEFRNATVNKARQDFIHSDYRAAAAKLEVVKNIGPRAAEAHKLLGSCYYELDEPKQASDEFQAALRLDPGNEQTYFNLGMLYLKYRTPELALLVFEHGLKELPDSPLLWMGMGLSQHLGERTDQAESSLKKALELDSGFTDAYVVLGDILETSNKLPDALEVFKTAIEKKPELYIGYFYYGKILLKLNEDKPSQALTALRKATELLPEFAEAHYELGRALERAGDTSGAIAEYKESTLRDPVLAGSQYRLALLYRKRGDAIRAERAMSAFKQAQAAAEGHDSVIKKLEYRLGKE